MTTSSFHLLNEASSEVWRVKLYLLGKDGSWQDQGTGDAHCSVLEGVVTIEVLSEDTSNVLLKVPIRVDENYERQQDSIIMWREPNIGGDVDCALSFQEVNGCEELWQIVLGVQDAHNRERGDDAAYKDGGAGGEAGSSSGGIPWGNSPPPADAPPPVPDVTVSTLSDIRYVLTSCVGAHARREIGEFLVRNDGQYVRTLLKLVEPLEAANDTDSLYTLTDILRSIALLSNETLLEVLLETDNFTLFAGAMEYDVALKGTARFREFLQSDAASMQYVPGARIKDKKQLDAISRLFKLRFLRDSLVRSGLEELGSAQLDHQVSATTNDVCGRIFGDAKLLKKIFLAVSSSHVGGGHVHEAKEAGGGEGRARADSAGNEVETRTGAATASATSTSAPFPSQDNAELRDIKMNAFLALSTQDRDDLERYTALLAEDPSNAEYREKKEQAEMRLSEIKAQLKVEEGVAAEEVPQVPQVARTRGQNEEAAAATAAAPSAAEAAEEKADGEKHAPRRHRSTSTDISFRQAQALRFLRELFALSRQLSFDRRAELYEYFSDQENSTMGRALLDLCVSVLIQPEETAGKSRADIAEILCCYSVVCPDRIRQYVLHGPSPAQPPPLSKLNLVRASSMTGSVTSANTQDSTAGGTLPSVASTTSTCSTDAYAAPDPTRPQNTGIEEQTVWTASLKQNKQCLLWALIRRMVLDTDVTVIDLLGDALRVIIDPERLHRQDKEKFLGHFYDHYIQWILVPFDWSAAATVAAAAAAAPAPAVAAAAGSSDTAIGGSMSGVGEGAEGSATDLGAGEDSSTHPTSNDTSYQSSPRSWATTSPVPVNVMQASVIEKNIAFWQQQRGRPAILASYRVLVDVMCTCVSGHAYRMKYYMLRNNTINNVLRLLQFPHRLVQVCLLCRPSARHVLRVFHPSKTNPASSPLPIRSYLQFALSAQS